jgi:glycosyltransferase involved in cell wall biosynthesis
VRILNLVASEKWTGAAAVVFDQTRALVEQGIEAQFGFVGASPLERRLLPLGWARPLFRRPRSPLDYPRDALVLRRTVLRERFDLVHAHLSHDHNLAVAALTGTGVPVLRTIHHLSHFRRDPLSRLLFWRTQAFAYANLAVARHGSARGPLLPPVVDRERFRPAEGAGDLRLRLGIPDDSFVVGTVGKLAPGRGHEEAIDALAALGPSAVLLHVGKGEYQSALEARAAQRGLAARNFWAGYQEDLLPDLYRAFDAFLFAASGSDQGQRAILEAMASGLPVVAFDLPGVRDLVIEGEQGFVVRSREEASGALSRLQTDPSLRTHFGRRGRERTRLFDAESFVPRALDFYGEALAVKKSSTS